MAAEGNSGTVEVDVGSGELAVAGMVIVCMLLQLLV